MNLAGKEQCLVTGMGRVGFIGLVSAQRRKQVFMVGIDEVDRGGWSW